MENNWQGLPLLLGQLGNPFKRIALDEERLHKTIHSAPSSIAVSEIYIEFREWVAFELTPDYASNPGQIIIKNLSQAPDLMTSPSIPTARHEPVYPYFSSHYQYQKATTDFTALQDALFTGVGELIPTKEHAAARDGAGLVFYFGNGGIICFYRRLHSVGRVEHTAGEYTLEL